MVMMPVTVLFGFIFLFGLCLNSNLALVLRDSSSRMRMPVALSMSTISSTTISSTQSNNMVTLKVIPGLTPELFAHPIDRRVTKQLRHIPLVEPIIRRLYSQVESGFAVDNLGSSILVGENQMPGLHLSLRKACKILDMETIPDLYVKQNPIPNAYTLAFMGRKPFIVVHTALLDLLDEDEVLAVIGHELGHLKCEHGLYITLFNLISEAVVSVTSVPLVPLFLRDLALQWQRSAELSCDRAALLATQGNVRSVASVIMKLVGGSSKNEYTKNLNLEDFLNQAEKLEAEKKISSRSGGGIVASMGSRQQTHPMPLLRASSIIEWSKSSEYRGIIARSIDSRISGISVVLPVNKTIS